MLVRGSQSDQHLGRRFEKYLRFGFIDPINIFAHMLDYFRKHLLNVPRMRFWITGF